MTEEKSISECIERMTEERYLWLKDYFAPLPGNLAPVTVECLREIDALRAELAEKDRRLDLDVEESYYLHDQLSRLRADVAALERERDGLREALEMAYQTMRHDGSARAIIAKAAARKIYPDVDVALRSKEKAP